jgi:DNA-binding response OmpR family regulator
LCPTKNILIADDDRDLVASLSIRCRALGLNVDAAHDAMTALFQINQSPPDLVILDVGMPSGNGLSVRKMMADNERLASIPVIILTGKSDEETIRRCHDTCAYYVPKCPDIWTRIEPLLHELLDLAPSDAS